MKPFVDECWACGQKFLNYPDVHGLPKGPFCQLQCAFDWELAQHEFERLVLGVCDHPRCSLPANHEGSCVLTYG